VIKIYNITAFIFACLLLLVFPISAEDNQTEDTLVIDSAATLNIAVDSTESEIDDPIAESTGRIYHSDHFFRSDRIIVLVFMFIFSAAVLLYTNWAKR